MAIIEFTIHVDNPIEVVTLFDRIEVWRSATQLGTYADITANDPTAALIDGTVAATWAVSGQSLTIRLNGADPLTVTFTGSNPLTLLQTLQQINAVISGFATETPTDTGKIRLTSPILGTQSSIELGGSATTTLGLSIVHTNGKGARLLLSTNTEDYLFRDFDGEDTYWYKTRYFSTVTNTVSSYSASFKGGDGTGIPGTFLVTGTVSMADITGKPVVGRRIILVPTGVQVVNDGLGNNYGVLPSVDRILLTTDENGQASSSLVKGQRIKVFLEGTTFQREFIVPTADFDILTVASTEPDPLTIVSSPPFPIRVS